MSCPRCGTALDPRTRTCPTCGPSGTRAPFPTPGPLRHPLSARDLEETEAGLALAQANLLRMRGRWDAAAEECAQVLRLDPGNPSAHSLLGDIYQDQGRVEEARHWYQLALELNPGSEADRLKLARTAETLEARQQRAEWEAVIEGRAQSVVASLQVRESLQRIGALAGAALCGIILVMATLATLSERVPLADENTPFGFRNPRRSQRPLLVADTHREFALLQKTNDLTPTGYGQAVRLELDSRTQSVRLRVSLFPSARDNVTSARLRERILHEAYRFAYGLRQAGIQLNEPDDNWNEVSVVVLGAVDAFTPSPKTDVLFDGVLHRSDLAVDPEKVSLEELNSFFERVKLPRWSLGL